VQKRAILRAISRRAAAIASDFRRSSIEQDQRSIKIGRWLQELSAEIGEPELKKKSRYKRF
jgi:hypothetical protein